MVLYPTFGWDEPAYHLEGDPEGRTFAEILVDVVATEVIEPWGGGKWHLEIFRSTQPRTRGLERRDVAPAGSGPHGRTPITLGGRDAESRGFPIATIQSWPAVP